MIAKQVENSPLAKVTWLGLPALVCLTFVALAAVVTSTASAAIVAAGDMNESPPASSPWHVSEERLHVGGLGPGSVVASDGYEIYSEEIFLGANPDSSTAFGLIELTGNGTSLTNDHDFAIYSGLLRIKAGAAATTSSLSLQNYPATFPNSLNLSAVTVEGTDSTLTISRTSSFFSLDHTTDTIHVSSGGIVNVNGGVSFTAGTFSLSGGTLNTTSLGLDSSGSLLPTGTGNINLSEAMVVGGGNTITIGAGLNVDVLTDPVTVESGSTLIVDGALSSTELTNNGTLVLITTTLDQPVVSPAGSVMNLIGSVVFNDQVSGAGGIFGSGTATFNGGYSPGDSPAVVELENNVIFGATNELSIELQGKLSGEFDQLDIAGDATLAGLLDVSLLGGFVPEAGDEFLVLDIAGSRNGEFTGLEEGAVVGNFAGVDLKITYTAGDGNDVALFAANFNSSAVVPEPTTFLLLTLGVLGFSRRTRRRRPMHLSVT